MSIGDSILFERGSIFFGQLVIDGYSGDSGKGLFLGAYGEGDSQPVFSGFAQVKLWTKISDTLWYADCSQYDGDRIRKLYIDNVCWPVGRYPNSGYRTISYTEKESLIVDDDLNILEDYWSDGEIVIKTRRWYLKVLNITATSADTIFFEKNNLYSITSGFGYFVQNHINTLDKNNEWYFDIYDRRLYLLKIDGKDPNTQNIQANFYDSYI